VLPYYFDFKCHVKERMIGKGIVGVFAHEFPARTRDYYVQAFQDGRLRVEGRQVAMDEPLKTGDCMRHFIHRHEPPVLAGDIQVGAYGPCGARCRRRGPGRAPGAGHGCLPIFCPCSCPCP
jgi:hypothetical protein